MHSDHVLSPLEADDLRDVILVAYSYSGVVAGQVADGAPERVTHVVYIDAFLPYDGKAMLDAFPDEQRGDELRQIAENGGRWPAPDFGGVSDN